VLRRLHGLGAGRARALAVATLGAGALAASGCGGGDDSGGSPTPPPAPPPAATGGTTLRIEAAPTALAFNKKTLSAKAGAVTIVMGNPSNTPHNVAIEGPGGVSEQGEVVSRGGTSQVSAEVKPGKYTYYCSVVGHREAGMEGTLTVK
jgi:plastocyanin